MAFYSLLRSSFIVHSAGTKAKLSIYLSIDV
jgi:hypothetical protein